MTNVSIQLIIDVVQPDRHFNTLYHAILSRPVCLQHITNVYTDISH